MTTEPFFVLEIPSISNTNTAISQSFVNYDCCPTGNFLLCFKWLMFFQLCECQFSVIWPTDSDFDTFIVKFCLKNVIVHVTIGISVNFSNTKVTKNSNSAPPKLPWGSLLCPKCCILLAQDSSVRWSFICHLISGANTVGPL